MKDITHQLRTAASRREGWTTRSSITLASTLATHLGCEIDWDEGAGEGWARLILADRVLALVWMAGPLIVQVEDGSRAPVASAPATTIAVGSRASTELSCDPAQLRATFGAGALSPRLDPRAFSGDDLWFATV